MYQDKARQGKARQQDISSELCTESNLGDLFVSSKDGHSFSHSFVETGPTFTFAFALAVVVLLLLLHSFQPTFANKVMSFVSSRIFHRSGCSYIP